MLNTNLLGGFSCSPVQSYLDCNKIAEDALGVVLQPDSSQREFGLHRILKRAKAVPFPGVNQESLEYLRSINTQEFADCQTQIIEMFGDDLEYCKPSHGHSGMEIEGFLNLFTPAFFRQNTDNNSLTRTVEQIIKLNDGYDAKNTIEPMVDVSIEMLQQPYIAPTAYLPHDSMFDECLNNLTIFDILSIFPETEARLLALSIGRALVGSDGTMTSIGQHEISHAFRTFCLIYGAAGTGKSTLFNFLFEAVEKTGYKIAHFNNIDVKFGLGEIVNANFAYSDDLLTDTLKKLLQAPLFKQIITGQKIRAEVKFADAFEVRSISTLFACINDFNSSVLNFCDVGTLNRLAIITTKSNREINNSKGSGLTVDSPNLRTRENIEWLTEKLGVHRDAIMLKFARLCADYFYNEIKNGTLESTTNDLKRNLRTQLHESLDASVIQLMQFCYLLRNKADYVPQLNGYALQSTFKSLNFVLNDDRCNFIRNELKQDWIKLNRPTAHIFTAIKLLDNLSVANVAGLDMSPSILNDPVKTIKAYWADLRLTSGFNLPANVASIRQNWSSIRSTMTEDSVSIIDKLKEHKNYEIVSDASVEPDIKYMLKASYDREAHIARLNK